MVPLDKGTPRRGGLPSWLVLGVLGLAAIAGGIFLPRSLRPANSTPEAAPAIPPAVKAGDNLEYNPPTLPELPSPGAMFLRLGLGTLVVLFLCVLTLWGGKRWIRPLAGPATENRELRVLEALPLGGRCSVYLLQAGETKVLAGVDGAGLKTLLTLPQSFDATLAEVRDAASSKAA